MGDLMRQEVSKNENLIVLAFLFIVSFTIFYFNVLDVNLNNSDWAYYAIAGKDAFSGNILLKGWYGSTNSFYSLDLLYGLVGMLVGYSPNLINTVSSILWACFVVMIQVSANGFTRNYSREEYYSRLMVIMAILSMSSYLHLSYPNVWGGSHFDTCMLGMLYVYVVGECLDKGEIAKRKVFASSVLLVLALFSDKLVLYFVIIPLLLYLFHEIINKNKKLSLLFGVTGITLVIVVVEKILTFTVLGAGGINVIWNADEVAFVTRDELFSRVTYVFECYMTLFSANAFGKALIYSNIDAFLNLLVVLAIIFIVFRNAKKLKTKSMNFVLMLMILLQLLVFIFTSYLRIDEGVISTTRILFYSFFAIIVLICQCSIDNINFFSRINRNYGGKVTGIIMLFICFTILIINGSEIKKSQTLDRNVILHVGGDKAKIIAEELKMRGLLNGYGTFWLANSTTLASNCDVKVVGVNGNSWSLGKFNWLANNNSSCKEAHFILVDDSGWSGITRDTVIECVGKPTEEVKLDNVSIMVYEYDVTPFIAGSGSTKTYNKWFNMLDNEREKVIQTTSKHFASVFKPREDGLYVSDGEGQLLYGPYKYMDPGIYNIEFYYTYDGNDKCIGFVDVFSSSGTADYQKKEIDNNIGFVALENVVIKEGCGDIEFRAYSYCKGVSIYKIVVKKSE